MCNLRALHKAIKESNYSELEICQYAGVSNTVISNIRNNRNITIKSIEKICLFLGIKHLDLVFDEESQGKKTKK